MTRYRWVLDRKAERFPITMACKIAEVSRQAFNDWRAKRAVGPTDAEQAEAELVTAMRDIHAETDGTYGEPRMTPELRALGYKVNHKRVERLMRANDIVGVHKPAKVRTTIPAEDNPPMPDLIGRRFDPGAPDVAWVGDITDIPTGEGWLYLSSVLDLGSRRWLGYSMADHMRTELVADALDMAVATRGGQVKGTIFHGDRDDRLNLVNTCPATTANKSSVTAWSNRSEEPGCAGTTRSLRQRGHHSNVSSCTATGSPRELRPAGRSSPGPTATTHTAGTPPSATSPPSTGSTNIINPRPARPRNQRDRPTGEAQTSSGLMRQPSKSSEWSDDGSAPRTVSCCSRIAMATSTPSTRCAPTWEPFRATA